MGKRSSAADFGNFDDILNQIKEEMSPRVPCQIPDRMKALGPSGLQPTIVPPRKLSPSLPVDLETIVLTAMAEEPEHRYQTAADLAADLARFLEDRPPNDRQRSGSLNSNKHFPSIGLPD